MNKISKYNERIAELISRGTGNMFFFWIALLFVLVLRISHPPTSSEFLLNLENDLQLLLLAVNAVVGGKQMFLLMDILKKIKTEEERIEKEEEKIEKEIDYLLGKSN